MTNLKIYKIHQNAIIPKHATEQAACFDISSYGNHIVPARHSMAIPTGLILDIPIGYSVRVHPRSGLAYKKGVTLLNAEGIIDSDYTDELKIIFWEVVF